MSDAKSRASTLAGVCVAIVLALVVIRIFYNPSGNETTSPGPVPTSSIEIPQQKMHCSDVKCVAKLARDHAAKLNGAGRGEDAKNVLAAAEALDRNDCNAAIDARNLVKLDPDEQILFQGADFTSELMNVCLLGGDLFANGDASVFQQDDDVSGPDRVRVELTLSDKALEPIGRQAGRLHHSVSWMIVELWKAGKTDVAKLAPATTIEPASEAGAAGPQIVFLPTDIAKEIDAEAARTKRSREALLERAWASAAPALAKMDAGP